MPDQDTLLQGLSPLSTGVIREIIPIFAETDGLRQIAEALSSRRGVDAIHVFSHGDDAQLNLGSEVIVGRDFVTRYQDELQAIGRALSSHADILIYGCNFGEGENILKELANITGADIAASDDVTGHRALGGDWNLEIHVGNIESEQLVSEWGQSSWESILASGSPVPTATLDVPDREMINEDFEFSVFFDNTGASPTDTGYTPYVDLAVPSGMVMNSAAFLGSPVILTLLGTFDAGGDLRSMGTLVNHPLTNQPVMGTPGDDFYVLELPFGSFVADQPVAEVVINATLDGSAGAVVGTPLDISATGGFALGCDPLANPGTDPPILGATAMDSVTPEVIALTKRYDAEDGRETATGPNHPVTYTLEVDVANGETVTNLDIRDFLPDSQVYLGSVMVDDSNAASTAGQSITDQPVTGSAQVAPDNDFLIEFTSVTGTTAKMTLSSRIRSMWISLTRAAAMSLILFPVMT